MQQAFEAMVAIFPFVYCSRVYFSEHDPQECVHRLDQRSNYYMELVHVGGRSMQSQGYAGRCRFQSYCEEQAAASPYYFFA